MRKIYIFDTTLRDGEQSPGVNLNTQEKVEIALQLEKLGVDRMEAGYDLFEVLWITIIIFITGLRVLIIINIGLPDFNSVDCFIIKVDIILVWKEYFV